MTAGKHNFICEQGATFNPTITWRDEAEDPVSLVNYTGRMHVRHNYADSDETILVSLTTENGRMTLGGLAGTIILYIDADDTDSLPSGTHKYDLELESNGGLVTRLLKGNFKVDPEVTR
jgi:hypothetical protein